MNVSTDPKKEYSQHWVTFNAIVLKSRQLSVKHDQGIQNRALLQTDERDKQRVTSSEVEDLRVEVGAGGEAQRCNKNRSEVRTRASAVLES